MGATSRVHAAIAADEKLAAIGVETEVPARGHGKRQADHGPQREGDVENAEVG